LNAAGFQAITFLSAEALLESGAAANAACHVLNIHLPGLSGFELRRRLQAVGTKAPAIFITAYDDPDPKPKLTIQERLPISPNHFRVRASWLRSRRRWKLYE